MVCKEAVNSLQAAAQPAYIDADEGAVGEQSELVKNWEKVSPTKSRKGGNSSAKEASFIVSPSRFSVLDNSKNSEGISETALQNRRYRKMLVSTILRPYCLASQNIHKDIPQMRSSLAERHQAKVLWGKRKPKNLNNVRYFFLKCSRLK